MTKVIVTGASGFIGSHLVRRLLQEGYAVTVLTRYANEVKNERLKDIWSRITVKEADIRNRGALWHVRGHYDICFHLAAYNHVGQSFEQVEECFDVNAKGSANLLDWHNGYSRFVYVSTSEIYGLQSSVPWHEDMKPNPQSPYAVSKLAGEMYCQLRKRMGGDIVMVRPFNTYGPWQSTKAVIPALIVRMLTGQPFDTTKGMQTREFNYVDDIVEGLIRAGTTTRPPDSPVNLCSGEEISIDQLCETLFDLTGAPRRLRSKGLPDRHNEIWRMCASNKAAQRLLGWKPKVDLVTGLKRTVDWFRSHL